MNNISGSRKSRGVPVKTPSLKAVAVAVILSLAASGCLSFFQQEPRYVDGTNIRIRENAAGDDYSVRIGESGTTVVDAILTGNGGYAVEYFYRDSHPLLVSRVVFETYCCLSSVETRNPRREELESGEVLETEEFPVQTALFSQILETDTPIIFIEGEKGSVIIKMGNAGKERLKELLDFGSEKFR